MKPGLRYANGEFEDPHLAYVCVHHLHLASTYCAEGDSRRHIGWSLEEWWKGFERKG